MKHDHEMSAEKTTTREHDHSKGSGHDHSHHIEEFKKKFIIALILTIPLLALSRPLQELLGFTFTIPFHDLIVLALSSAIYAYAGKPFLTGLVREVKNKQPGMMTLIGSAISVAFFYSIAVTVTGTGKDLFWELATLIDVMLLGHWIEARSVQGASKSLRELASLMPKTAHLVKGEEAIEVPLSELKRGDVVLVKPGERIPSDGVVLKGASFVNEAFLTGESKPVQKKQGSEVVGGSVNGDGVLRVKIEKTGEENYISQVIKLVREAQESKSKTQDVADRAAAFLFYAAAGAGILTLIAWLYYATPSFAIERMVAVLVIACPHALGLAIPLVVAISTSITASQGVLVKNRKSFEDLKDVNAVIFDKTGTLTLGEFKVSKVLNLNAKEKDVLEIFKALEKNSEHVIGKTINEYCKKKKVKDVNVENVKNLPGLGIQGVINGKTTLVGGPNLLKKLKLTEPKEAKELKSETLAYAIQGKKILGFVSLSDELRPEAVTAVKKLRARGIKVYMITGDSERVAKKIARDIGITDYFAEVLPDEKARHVKSLQEKGFKVAMVGDGVNDAPALATADIGIAIGAGTSVAIESAGIVLVKNDPGQVLETIEFSKQVYSKMVQNLWWAAGYNILAVPLAAGVLINQGILLNPAVGALLMSASTVIVAVNSQTLKKMK